MSEQADERERMASDSGRVDVQVPSSSSDTRQAGSTEPLKKKPRPTVKIVEPPPRERTPGYSIVSIEEKHGLLHRAIPVMPLPLAILCCLLNILGPGVGTLISAFTVPCCGPTRCRKPIHAFGLNLLSALLQMLTFILIIGWIWSILWGMTFVTLSLESKKKKPRSSVPYYVRRQSSLDHK